MKYKHSPIILLVISFFLSVVTLLFTDRYLSKRAVKEAERFNTALIDEVCVNAERQNLIVERAARSFLMNWFAYPEADSVDFTSSPLVIKDSETDRFANDIYEALSGFMKANDSRFESCHFIIAPGYVNHYESEYFIPYASIDGDSAHSILTGDILNPDQKIIANLMNLELDTWITPGENSLLKDYSSSYYLPLRCEDGSVFGVFGVNVSVDRMQLVLKKYLPYTDGNSSIRVEDLEGKVICSTESLLDHSKSHVFRKSLVNPPFSVVIECSDKAIYSQANKTIKVVTVVALVGMFLMLSCMLLTLERIRREEKEKASVESEVRLAAQLQSQLLRNPSEISGENFTLKAFLKPALKVGGDLYDFVLKGENLIFVVGDVSGKGMPAAMFMTQVCSLFRSYSSLTDDPCQIVSHINHILSDGNASMTFCTLIVGTLDTRSGRLLLANAGHNPPAIISGGDARFQTLESNIPVAIEEDITYDNNLIELGNGDSILLYTDGVTEARNPKHKLYGDRRLLDLVKRRGADDLDTIIGDIREFVGQEPQSDDITLLCVNYKRSGQ